MFVFIPGSIWPVGFGPAGTVPNITIRTNSAYRPDYRYILNTWQIILIEIRVMIGENPQI